MRQKPIDYTREVWTKDHQKLVDLGEKLGQIACDIEQKFGFPQDIEGCLDQNGQVYITQSRNQITDQKIEAQVD